MVALQQFFLVTENIIQTKIAVDKVGAIISKNAVEDFGLGICGLSIRGRGSFKVDWCCSSVTSCSKSNFHASYESYGCYLLFAIW